MSEMIIQKMFNPFEHVIVDNIYNETELALIAREFQFLGGKFNQPLETLPATNEDGIPLKKNKAIFLDQVFTNRSTSDILRINRKVFQKEILATLSELHPSYGLALTCNMDGTILNHYVDGDYYDAHSDASVFTFITFFIDDVDSYSGGDFVFPEFDYIVQQKNNRVVIFPGCIKHQVTKLNFKSADSKGRFSMSQFLNIGINND